MELPTHDRIIIFPDIHGRKFWKDVDIKDYDKAIFLGDYLDPYPQEEITDDMALANFKEILKLHLDNPGKIIFLLGNHDLHYFSEDFPDASRYSRRLGKTYHDLFMGNKNFFQLAYECKQGNQAYLFTHAGLVIDWFERNMNLIGTNFADAEALNKFLTVDWGMKALAEASHYRGDLYSEGSIVWSDVRERFKQNNREVTDYFQIFAHTMLQTGKMIQTEHWACIDCQRPVELIENKLNIL